LRVLIGIQARSGSTRLPGKIFMEIDGTPMLKMIYDKACLLKGKSRSLDVVVSALVPGTDVTTYVFCAENGIEHFKGHETDLVDRYLTAMENYEADAVIRVTGDCPLIPVEMIAECIKVLDQPNVDYVSNIMETRSYPEGWDVQGASSKGMDWVDREQEEDREHPFKHLDENDFIRKNFVAAGLNFKPIFNRSNLIFRKLSVDTEKDLKNVREEYDKLQGK